MLTRRTEKNTKRKIAINQIHGTETKVGERAVHGDDTATMSAGADRIRRRRDVRFLGRFSRRSKLPEESKAGSASQVEGAVVVVPNQIDAPVCAYPLSPGNG